MLALDQGDYYKVPIPYMYIPINKVALFQYYNRKKWVVLYYHTIYIKFEKVKIYLKLIEKVKK